MAGTVPSAWSRRSSVRRYVTRATPGSLATASDRLVEAVTSVRRAGRSSLQLLRRSKAYAAVSTAIRK
jgi:hypothetical protein